MSNQCSNLFNNRSFSLFTPFNTPLKPYLTTFRPIFAFHQNLVLIGTRSRSRSSSLPPPLAAQSSSDIVLIATTEYRDGSLVFRFGDASEVVENDEVVEEIESQAEQESDVVKVLDGDQERQVIIKAIERGYGSDGGQLTEIRNADIDSDVAEKETNAASDSRDIHAESSKILSVISEEEVLSMQSDANMVGSLEVVESKLDKSEFGSQVDVDESSNPNLSLLDISPKRDNSEDTEGKILKDSDDEIEDPSVSVKLESSQVSQIEAMNDLDKVETEDTSESDTEDIMPPATMHISDGELMEEFQDVNINQGTLLNETSPSDPLVFQPTLDELSDLQSLQAKVEATMEVSSTTAVDVKDQAMEDELQQVITNNKEENDVAYVMPVFLIEEAEPIIEEEVSQLRSTPLELNPTIQVSDIEPPDTMGQNLEDEIIQVNDEIEDQLVSVKLETTQISNLDKAETGDTSEGDTKDLLPPEIMNISDIELTDAANEDVGEELQDMNINEGTLIDVISPSDPLGAEPTLDEATMEVSSTKGMDVMARAVEDELQQVSTHKRNENNVADVMPADHILEEEVNQPPSTPVVLDPTVQVSDIEVQDAKGQTLDGGILQVIDEVAGDSYVNDVEQLSHQLEAEPVQDEGVDHNILEQSAETDALESSILLEQGSSGPLLEAERIECLVSSSELAEVSEDTTLVSATEANVKREETYLTGYFLSSGAALLKNTFTTGADDAYFLAGSKWLGVANGVSQWSFEGINPGVYAQELMRTCEDIVLDTNGVSLANPVELLCRGVKEANMSGSSNVLIATFDGQSLHVANIGDTGFLIIRHGAIYKKSSPLLHEFHFALQVDDCDDPLQLVEEHTIELDEGDVVVSATDGLFDNLYEREIAIIVSKSLQAGMKSEEIANLLATRAEEVGRSAFVRSPFSDAAQTAGYTGYAGGKPDNVAVIVSLVEKRSTFLQSNVNCSLASNSLISFS